MLYLPRGAKSGQENGGGTTFRKVPESVGKSCRRGPKIGRLRFRRGPEKGASFRRKTESKLEMKALKTKRNKRPIGFKSHP